MLLNLQLTLLICLAVKVMYIYIFIVHMVAEFLKAYTITTNREQMAYIFETLQKPAYFTGKVKLEL